MHFQASLLIVVKLIGRLSLTYRVSGKDIHTYMYDNIVRF